mmetsp:Transcript_94457/g.211748  ORF Transcript_94457/g.211748 Transcript_94457/m.211748 type:complete len:350 (-) Transcript_94457:195-1244(-)
MRRAAGSLHFGEGLQRVVRVRVGHVCRALVARHAEVRARLVVARVEAAQVPDTAQLVRQPAVGLAAGRQGEAQGILVVRQQAALLDALAHRQLLVRVARTGAGLPTADGELLAGVAVPEVQAVQTVVLAASGRGDPVGVLLLGEQGALLVADAQEQLLVLQARARPVRAGAVAGHREAGAGHLGVDRELLVHGAGVALAASPRARADRVLAAGEQAALPVAQASEELLVPRAEVPVMKVLPSWRRRCSRRQGHAGRGDDRCQRRRGAQSRGRGCGRRWPRRDQHLLAQLRLLASSARRHEAVVPPTLHPPGCEGDEDEGKREADGGAANAGHQPAPLQYWAIGGVRAHV